MFKLRDKYVSNKDEEFLQNSEIVIGWKVDMGIQINGDEDFVLLLSRLAYVFEIVSQEIQNNKDYEEFLDILRGVRIKKTLLNNNTSLPKIADLLSKIDKAKSVSIVVNEDEYDIIMNIINFGAMIGFDKVGLYFTNLDEKLYEFRLIS